MCIGVEIGVPRDAPGYLAKVAFPKFGAPWVPWGPLGPLLYTEYQINYKNRSRKIGTLIKYEKQKCDLQFAPTELNEFHIEIPSIFMDFLYTTPGPIFWGPGGGQGPPRGPKFNQKFG